MSILMRILLVVAVVAGLGAGFAGIKFKELKTDLQTKLKSTEDDRDKLNINLSSETKAKQAAENESKVKAIKLAEANSEIEKTKGKIATQRSKITEVESKLSQTSKELTDKQAQIDSIIQVLPKGIEPNQIGDKLKELQESFATLDQEKKVLGQQLTRLTMEKEKLEKDAAMRKEGVMPDGLTGRVLQINPEWNFVVLSIGSKQGVVPNAAMMVHRDGKLIGKIKVTSAEPTISIADIMPDWKQAELQEGDLVTY